MSSSHPRRSSVAPVPIIETVPPAPPLPPQQQRYGQQARLALGRVLGFGGKATHSPEQHVDHDHSWDSQPLTSSNATAVHRTGLEINALSMNEAGTHALIAGKQIFKTIRVDGDSCAEDKNIRTAIRRYNASVGDNGSANVMPKEAVDIHDVAWARGTTGNFIAAATYNGPIILYDLNRLGIEIARLFDHRRQVHRVTFNPHAGHYMLSASQDGTVRMWDIRDCQRSVTTFTSQRATPGQADGIRDVKWSPTNGTEFALGTDGGWIQKWDTQMMRTAKVKIAGHATACSTIDWHPDGKHLLSAGTDKVVRVWNVYSDGRRQKPLHEVRVPHPPRSARWRPAFQSFLHGDSGVRQCTQLVTSYDKDYPLMHIWDLRRPHLPFRELECYQTAPTDLLWHSQDLLWTVGREGIFTQTDVSYATKSIDKRNVQAFGLSPHGEVNVVTQTRRPKLEIPRSQPEEPSEKLHRMHGERAPTRIRSAFDDTIDDNFLSASLKINKRRSGSAQESRSLGETPPSVIETGKGRTLALDSKMERFRPLKPMQMAARGVIPGPMSADLTTYFAYKYKLRPYLFPPTVEALLDIHRVFEQNAHYAKLASMYRLSQSWRVIGHMLSKHIRQRAESNRRARLKRGTVVVKSHDVRDEITAMVHDIVASTVPRPSNPPTPLAVPVRRTEALRPPSFASGSNMPTPRAFPSDSNIPPATSASKPTPLLDIDSENLSQLPPRVVEPEPNRPTSSPTERTRSPDRRDREDMQRLLWQPKIRQPLSLSMEDDKTTQSTPRLLKHDSEDSFMAFPLSNSQAPSLPDSMESSQARLMDMVAQDLQQPDQPIEEDARAGQEYRPTSRGQDYRPTSRDGRTLTVEGDATRNGTSRSRDRSFSRPDPDELLRNSTNTPIPVPDRPKSRSDMNRDMRELIINNQESFTSDTDLNPNSHQEGAVDGLKVERGTDETSVPQADKRPPSRDIDHMNAPLRHKEGYDPRFGAFLKSSEHSPKRQMDEFVVEDFFSQSSPSAPESANGLFNLSTMVQQLVTYHTNNLSDAQSLTALLLLLTPLLPESSPVPRPTAQTILTHYADHFSSLQLPDSSITTILTSQTSHLLLSGLNPLQLESILSTYHTQLLTLSLPIPSALLRRLAYPLYPAVYDSALKDNTLSFRCSSCSKPLSAVGRRCASCDARPARCPVCWTQSSPYALLRAKSVVEELYTTCLACNHGAHTACLAIWHGLDAGAECISEGVCPVEGCGCRCLAPSVQQRAGGHVAGGRRVVEEDRTVGESRAVTAARRGMMMGSGRMSGASAGSGGSGGSGGRHGSLG